MPFIIKEEKGRALSFTLNNPEKKNALSLELCRELTAALEEAAAEKIPAVIIRARKNARVWSSGHDINQLPLPSRDPLAYDSPMEQTLRAIQNYPGAVIAMVQGGVWGGATDLVATCDIAVGDRTASFAITPVKIGLPYNASGIMHFINRLGSNIAREMFFTAAPVKAVRALRIGLLNHLIPQKELESFTFELAATIAGNSPLAVAVVKEQFRVLTQSGALGPEAFERVQSLRRRVYSSKDYSEGIKAFLEKRKPVFTGE